MSAPAEQPARVELRAFAVSITPFDRDGPLDEAALRAHLRRLAQPGLGVYVGGGGSGEGHSLTIAEHSRVLEIAVDEIGSTTRVRAMGIGHRHADEAIEFVAMASRTGVDAVQVYSPEVAHGHLLNRDELHRFLDAVIAACEVPCVLSTHRSVGYALPLDVVDALSAIHRHVVGINCTQDWPYLRALLERCAGRIDVHLGGEAGALDAIALGATGFLSSTANLSPRLVARFASSLDGPDVATMLQHYGALLRLAAALGGSGGIATLKALLGELGLPAGVPRPPLLPREAADVRDLVELVRRAGLPETESFS